MKKKKSKVFNEQDDIKVLPGFQRLGWGYDIFGEYASPNSMEQKVFDLNTFLDDKDAIAEFEGKSYKFPSVKSGYFTFSPQVEKIFIAAAGRSMESYRENISNSFNGGGVIGAFTGSLSLAKNTEVYKKTSSAYSMVFYLENNYKIEVYFKEKSPDDVQYLIGLFKEIADNVVTLQDGLDLMNRYGTHVVTSLNVGKRSTRYASTEKSLFTKTDEFKAVAKASFAESLDVSYDYDDKTELKKFKEQSVFFTRTHGSDAQNTIVEFPEKNSLVPIWEVYKDNNSSISKAFDRLKDAYKFITSILGLNEKIVTDIDFSYDTSDLKDNDFTIIKDKDGDYADMRYDRGGEYIYMGIKKSSVLDVLKGAKPVVHLIKTTSDDSGLKKIEGYTGIDCDFHRSVDYTYEYAYYKQVEIALPENLTKLLEIGLSLDYAKIKEQAYAYAADDKFKDIQKGLAVIDQIKKAEIYGDMLFTEAHYEVTSQGVELGTKYPYGRKHYEDRGYKIISDNLVVDGSNDNYRYIMAKPAVI